MNKGDVPDDTTAGFVLEFVWKSTTFDRMTNAMKLFRDYTASISGALWGVLGGVGCWLGWVQVGGGWGDAPRVGLFFNRQQRLPVVGV